MPPVIAFGQIFDSLDLPGEKAAPERTVGHIADSQFSHGRQDGLLRLSAPQRVFGQQGADRMHLWSAGG